MGEPSAERVFAHPAVQFEGTLSLEEHLEGDRHRLSLGVPFVRVALVGKRGVSYGVGVPETASYLERARAEALPVVRRSTGGTALLHLPGDLLWSIILPRSDPRVGRDFARAYGRFGKGVTDWLAGQGRPAQWTAAPGLADEYCTLSDRGEVLSLDGRILGGAAQHVTGTGFLHQGTVSLHVDRGAIDRLFDFAGTSPSARLAGLAEFGIDTAAENLGRTLAGALAIGMGFNERRASSGARAP
jgi:lipoate-protein ligase A